MIRLKRGLASLIACGIFIIVFGNTLFVSAQDKVYLDEKYYPANFTTCIKQPGYIDWERLGWLKLTEIPTGGVHLDMVKSIQNVRYGVTRITDVDGLHIVYDNYTKAEGASGFFTVTLSVHSYNSDYLPDLGANAYGYLPFVLIIDTVDGNLIARSSQSFSAANPEIAQTILLSNNDNLKYAALKDKPWDIRFKKVSETNYSVTINGVTANIPVSVLVGKGSTLELNACYTVFGTWAGNNTMSYDIMSVHGGDEICADEISAPELLKATKAIDSIKAIGTIKAGSDATIKTARGLYTALPTQIKGLVYNLNILTTAETVYPTVKAISDIGKVTINSKDDIDKAIGLYASLSTENRQLVSNWQTMIAAQSELIRLKSIAGEYITMKPSSIYEISNEIDENSDNSFASTSTSSESTSTTDSMNTTESVTSQQPNVSKAQSQGTSGNDGNTGMLIAILSILGVLVGIGSTVLIIKSRTKSS